MPRSDSPTWQLKARFRRHAFGWRSQPAVHRVKQATAEIRKAARRDPLLAAEGAVESLGNRWGELCEAAEASGTVSEVRESIRQNVRPDRTGGFVSRVLAREFRP